MSRNDSPAMPTLRRSTCYHRGPPTTPRPKDQADQLWFDMLKPLMRMGTGTDIAHLEAFVTYANHENELALHRARTLLPVAPRSAKRSRIGFTGSMSACSSAMH